ncbi:MAG: exodeoxyribonuclease VII large subunit [Alphaproteobacteria bacterium]
MTDSESPGQSDSEHNLPPILSVGELSSALKRTIEQKFGTVRLRGEISQSKVAGSGHCYLRLKDADAVIDGIIWRGVMRKLSIRPEEGLEVICMGRLTTYPGRSSYQIIIEQMELAGEGALLKMLEERRKRLAAEGLFDADRKQDLPYLPAVIGVVTSPTGAVIRDILHRLADRFPRHVLLAPVAVQGERAADQIAGAIQAFNKMAPGGGVPRPDLLIVARGGGSLDDLMAFNEEVVVRAAAASTIPLISAVGHETDTTLIDFAADRRAPTPTAAAEMAVPVRAELLAQVGEDSARLVRGMTRYLREQMLQVQGLGRGLPRPERLIETAMQRLDDRAERLTMGMSRFLESRGQSLSQLGFRLPTPKQHLDREAQRLDAATNGLRALVRHTGVEIGRQDKIVADQAGRLRRLASVRIDGAAQQLAGVAGLLESYAYERVLERGFAMVFDKDGALVSKVDGLRVGQDVSILFQDQGRAEASIRSTGKGGAPEPSAKPKRSGARGADGRQGSLL